MLDVKSIEILNNSICSLKETSKDNHAGTDDYMTDSMLPVVNFDMVKNEYIKGLKIPEAPKSNDAFYVNGNGDMYFIEFKSGRMDNNKIYGVRQKIYDSLLILTDIINVGISYTRQNLNYILVYNELKNPLEETEKQELQTSPSRTKIGNWVAKKAKKELIRFRLERFKNLYFKNVCTYTEEEFEASFVKKWT